MSKYQQSACQSNATKSHSAAGNFAGRSQPEWELCRYLAIYGPLLRFCSGTLSSSTCAVLCFGDTSRCPGMAQLEHSARRLWMHDRLLLHHAMHIENVKDKHHLQLLCMCHRAVKYRACTMTWRGRCPRQAQFAARTSGTTAPGWCQVMDIAIRGRLLLQLTPHMPQLQNLQRARGASRQGLS